MVIRKKLDSIAEERIIILDGAMGSLIQVLNLDEKSYRGNLFTDYPTPLECCNDLLFLTRPGAIGAIHDTYLEAGADIIETCSFNSSSIVLNDYGLGHLSYDISAAAARIARKSADKISSYEKPRFVAGSLGPTNKGASLYPDVNNPEKRSIKWSELEASYYENARGLLDGGIDLFLVETVFDTLNAKAALYAITRLLEERRIDVPIIISAAISSEGGQLLSGQNLEAFLISLQHIKPWAVGLNCSFDAPKIQPHLKKLSETASCYTSAYPNAGIPNKFGRYDQTPESMSSAIESYFKEGLVNIIGGCCGTTPAHIAAISKIAQNYSPRKVSRTKQYAGFSGLEPLYIKNGTVCLKNNNDPKLWDEFKTALASGDYEDAADIARDIIENGCEILNIETDDENVITKFLDYALMNPYIAKKPFYINSQKLSVLKAGLMHIQGRGFAGPINLTNGEAEFIHNAKVIQRYGAAAVITLDNEKIENAQKIYRLLKEIGYSAENIVFNPDVTNDDSVCLWIRDNCPGVLIAL